MDLSLGALFVGAYLTTRHNTRPNDRTDNQEEAVTRVTSRDEDIEIGYVDISSLKKAALVLNELEVVVHDENRDGKHKLIVCN